MGENAEYTRRAETLKIKGGMMDNIKKMDIVYVLKDAAYNEELRYSLRSVDRNFPCKKVWFYGAKPVGLKADKIVPMPQEGARKWDRVRGMLKAIAENDKITENFVLFNDDFFVIEKVKDLPYIYCGTLADLCVNIEIKNDFKPTPYTAELKKTIKAIRDKHWHIDGREDNYELHIPMVFNRKLLKKVIEMFPDNRGTRSLYANYLMTLDDDDQIWGDSTDKDVKIIGLDEPVEVDPSLPYVSTDDNSFENGAVGELIRTMFPKKSRFEK